MTDELDRLLRDRIRKVIDEQPARSGDWQDVLRRSEPERLSVRRARARRPILLLAGVTTCAVLLALGLALRGVGSTGVGTAQAACRGSDVPAGRCLRALARIARTGGKSFPIVYRRVFWHYSIYLFPPGEALKLDAPVRSRRLAGTKTAFVASQVSAVETWVNSSTGQGVQRTGPGRLVFPTARDRAAWRDAGSPTWKRMSSTPLAPGSNMRIRDWAAYAFEPAAWHKATGVRNPFSLVPTEAGAVIRMLRRVASAAGAPGSSWPDYADEALQYPFMRPAQRAALFAAIARAPGARVLGQMRDPLGREGVAVSNRYSSRKLLTWRWVYVYDPRTSQLLAEGIWPRRLSPQTSGWRASGFFRVYAVGAAAANRIPELTKER